MIKLCEKYDCTGCGACMNVCPKHAIKMTVDQEGFLYPQVDASLCVECQLCQKACHILFPVDIHPQVDNPIAVVAKSDAIREKSSSGGMFSILAHEIISRGGIVYGAGFGEEYSLFHQKAENEDELVKLRGSKYYQSDIKETYKEVKLNLKQERDVLFTGTPCQIAGLYAYLGKCNLDHLYTADIVCHGVPSSKSFHLFLEKLAITEGCAKLDIQNYTFRDLNGWNITPSYKTPNKVVTNQPLSKNLFMQLFLNSLLHRECCYHCRYTKPSRVSDITLADFWGIGTVKAFHHDTTKGCSLVLVNSEKGKMLFESIAENIYFEHREWKEALAQNHQLYMSSIRPKRRSGMYTFLENHTPEEVYQYCFNTPILKCKRLVSKVLKCFHLR